MHFSLIDPSGTKKPLLKRVLLKFSMAEYLMLGFVIIYAALSYFLAAYFDHSDSFKLFLYGGGVHAVSALILVCFVSVRIYYIMAVIRPERLTRYLINDFRTKIFTPERMIRALIPLFSFTIIMGAFTSMKTLIPVFNAYQWDQSFYELDNFLHFGIEPWRILQPILGFNFVTYIINVVYNVWFVVLFGVLFWQLFTLQKPHIRIQFFYTCFLTWVINGTFFAVLFSSVGPCYYAEVVGGTNPFAPLMDYLYQANEHFPIWAVSTQEMLWNNYQNSKVGVGSGISAMPSMHVSTAFLFFLVGLQTNRWAAISLGIFALFIMIGSVHLGWHYAVDGYFSIITTWLIWRFAGWSTKKIIPVMDECKTKFHTS